MVASAKRAKSPPNTRLTVGNFIADVLVDSREPYILFHWIVQRIGSAEILHWGQETNFAEAESAATAYLYALDERDRKEA